MYTDLLLVYLGMFGIVVVIFIWALFEGWITLPKPFQKSKKPTRT